MAHSSDASFSPARRYGGALLGLPLLTLGLFLIFAFPQDMVPWPAKASTLQAATCGAGPDTVACVVPASQDVSTSDPSFGVEIVVDNVSDLGAYEFTLGFNPTFVSFLGAANGPFLGSTGRSVTCFPPTVTAGSARLNCVTLGTEPDGPSGAGVLATVNFAPLAPGTSALELTSVILTDVAGNPIAHTTQDGSVTVVVGPTPTSCPGGVCPTATSTPTATVTPTPAVGPTTLLIDPPSQGQLTGSTFTVNVALQNVTNLAAYEFTLAWDQTVLDFVDVTNGAFLGSSGRVVSCPPPTVGVNTVRFGCVTTGPSPPGPSGSGVLSVLTFQATDAGTSVLDLFDVGLSSPLGAPLIAVIQDGTVTVTVAPTPTPTPCPGGICPTPTITPTPTVTSTPTSTPVPVFCAPGAGTRVCVLPASQTVPTSTNFSVDVAVDDVTDLGAYRFTLEFDPALVAFTSVENGGFLGSTGRTANCLPPVLTVSSVEFTCVTLGATPAGPSGSGVLASATFLSLSEGTSPLDLQDTQLTDVRGAALPATEQYGAVTVLAGPTSTPTITPTPADTPTPGPSPTPTPITGTLTFVDPASQTVSVGTDFSVDVSIQNVTNLGSYEWYLTYDPALIDFVSVANGPFLGSTGRTVFCPGEILDVGSIRYGCSTIGTTPPAPGGAGVLSTITFSALAEGTSTLNLVTVSLSDPLAEDIPTAILDGSVTVEAAPTPTETATATPSGGGASLAEDGADSERDPARSLAPKALGGLITVIGAASVLRNVRRNGGR